MAILTLEELLSPFEFLDIGGVYDRYAAAIDFIIAFLLFLGISKVTLGRRFEGRGGKLVITAVALALSVGFSLIEREANFSLRSFGSLGVLILIFLISIVLFNLFRTAGVSKTSSFCLAYIIVYLSLRLISPAIFDWIAQTAPWINGILGLAFVVSGIKLVLSLFRSRKFVESLPAKLRDVGPLENEVQHEIEEEDSEKNLVKGKMRKLTKKDLKRSEDIIGYLKHIIKVIDECGNIPEGKEQVSKELRRTAEGEHYILGKLDYLEKLNAKIERHDTARLGELEQKYGLASGKQKSLLRKEIGIEYQKIKIEEGIKNLKQRILKLTQGFNNSVNTAVDCLQEENYTQDAKKHLNEAISYEAAMNRLFNDISKLENSLIALAKRTKKIAMNTA
ncbi:hypothetical protein GTN66_06695 [bacterium]|nr:hypothetical protein [bacterium]NIO20993.1 hypothetical protein [Candidatus Aenigmarchaeota archaeon]NIO74083.1 hypothetical protein [bacterium]